MCGIVGFTWEDKDLVKTMCKEIAHRGPNDEGTFVDRHISLGHRRLSIVDLSPRGHQPMFNEDGKVVVVFNGEIYNYRPIKKALEEKGHKFASDSDTEVIIHGYEEYGEEICSKLEGMYAFAVWDAKHKTLLLARDRIGKKPIYYWFQQGKLVFASEIKAILLHEEVKRQINYQCFSDYLTLRYSPGSSTMFQGIQKLEPGHYLIYKDKKLKKGEHWKLPEFSDRYPPEEKRVDNLIAKAVEKRLMGDVPIGAFLSGGLDSSSIVAYMSHLGAKVRTYCVGFGDSTDESKYAEIVARHFNTEHKTILLDKEVVSLLPKIAWHFDEPLADPASVPTYQLCERVSKEVKVALSGEGGDETFGGYDTFNYIKKVRAMRKVPTFVGKSILAKSLSTTAGLFQYPKKQMLLLGAELIAAPKNTSEAQKKLFYLPFATADKQKLLHPEIAKKVKIRDPLDDFIGKTNNPWNDTNNYYYKDWLPNDLLMKGDKMSMAHGLEMRMPYLDTDLISYFSGISNEYKQDRFLFRKVVSPLLPKKIMQKKKQGFTLPLSSWFARPEFSERLMPQLTDLGKRNLFEQKEYQRIIQNPRAFRNDHRLWVLLNFELWHKIYLDKIPYQKIQL